MQTSRCLELNHAHPGDTVAASLLAHATTEELPALIEHILVHAPVYDRSLHEMLLAALETHQLIESPLLSAACAPGSTWCQSISGTWLAARLLELRGEFAAAYAAYSSLIERGSDAMHEALLARARLAMRLDRCAAAFVDLRRAILHQDEYDFLSRAARLFERLTRVEPSPATHRLRIALLASTTTDLLAPLLRLACFREGIATELYVAPYGNIQQEVRNPASGLYAFQPDIVLIATHWRDAQLPPLAADPAAEIARVVDELQLLWATLLAGHPCRIIQHGFDLPVHEAYGSLSRTVPGGRGLLLRAINRRLVESAPDAVALLDLDHVAACYGKQAWFDAAYWHAARQYPAASALPLLVNHQVALICAAVGVSRKVLVLDLDNTLWGGVIGEDGLAGIRLGPPSPSGEAHQDLQRYAAELKERGILLAACSKNNPGDARLPFEQHDAMILRLDDLVAFEASWQDKPAGLRAIAARLNLGVDSLVFLDDNPVERALVRRELPEVATPEPGSDPATFVAALDRGMFFEALKLSDEDRQRHASYRANALRAELHAAAGSLDEFLAGLQMTAESGAIDENVLARVVQLIGKTNQFNLTTRRYSSEQVRQMLLAADYWTQYFKLADRFGDNGLVGLLIARATPDRVPTWEIDSWLMSCRVIGRNLEQLMLRSIGEAAHEQGINLLRGVYRPTPKNALVADLYPRLGFHETARLADGSVQYVFDLAMQALPTCSVIKVSQPLVSP